MKKILTGLAAATIVVAPIAFSTATANADVARQCTTVTTVAGTPGAATFTAIQPKDFYGQWTDIWTHNYTVTVQPDGSFSGTGNQFGSGLGDNPVDAETLAGTFFDTDNNGKYDHVTYTIHRASDNASWTLTNAPMDSTSAATGTSTNATAITSGDPAQTVQIPDGQVVEFHIDLLSATATAPVTTDFANHGAYVSAMGGGKDAAQSCVGMPSQSKAPKK